jgi:hypothetical protein
MENGLKLVAFPFLTAMNIPFQNFQTTGKLIVTAVMEL